MGDAPSHNAPQQARSGTSSLYCITLSTSIIFDTMHSPLSVSRALLLYGIYISNIGSIAILWPVYMGFITESFLVLSAVLSVLALSVFPIVTCGRISEIGNTRYLIIFGALCLLYIPSCITLTFRAVQDHATALCQDLSESDDCTLTHVFIGFYYTSMIFAIIGFVITYIDRRAGSAPNVSPHYPNARATGPPFGVAAFQYPQDVELENVNVITELPARKAKQVHAERSSESPV